MGYKSRSIISQQPFLSWWNGRRWYILFRAALRFGATDYGLYTNYIDRVTGEGVPPVSCTIIMEGKHGKTYLDHPRGVQWRSLSGGLGLPAR